MQVWAFVWCSSFKKQTFLNISLWNNATFDDGPIPKLLNVDTLHKGYDTLLFLMKHLTDTDVGYNISILIYIEVLLNYAKESMRCGNACAYEPYAVIYHKCIGYRIILKQYVYCVMYDANV